MKETSSAASLSLGLCGMWHWDARSDEELEKTNQASKQTEQQHSLTHAK
jgi:hypothetical protein